MLLEGLLAITQGGVGVENIVAAISGRSDDSVGMVIHRNGASDTNPDALQRAIDFLRGSVLRRPNFLVSKDGRLSGNEVDLTGHINADSGRIGHFNIFSNIFGESYLQGNDNGNIVHITPNQIRPLNSITNQADGGSHVLNGQLPGMYVWGQAEVGGTTELQMDTQTASVFGTLQVNAWYNVGNFNVAPGVDYTLTAAVTRTSNNQSGGASQIHVNLRGSRIINNATGAVTNFLNNQRFPNLPAGNYRLEVEALASWSGGNGWSDGAANAQFRVNGASFEHINHNYAMLAHDGIAIALNDRNYLYYNTRQGLEIRTQNSGFRVTGSGIQRWNGQWVSI
jgi:hypothetical protein